MTKITHADRAAARTYLLNSTAYDASTMVISRKGEVTACKDADKTFSGPEVGRYFVGWVGELGA